MRVDDADAAAARVPAAGGRVFAGPFGVVGGRVVACADPAGAAFCLWEPGGGREGAELVNAAGSWNWSNLETPDRDGAAAFYGAVFGWEVTPMGDVAMWRLPGYGDVLAERDPDLRRRHAEVGVPPGFSDAIGWVAAGDPAALDRHLRGRRHRRGRGQGRGAGRQRAHAAVRRRSRPGRRPARPARRRAHRQPVRAVSLTTHVLDVARGRPAAGVAITLLRGGEVVATAVTNADGRTDAPLLDALEAGEYELRFAVGDYFGDGGVPRRRAGAVRRRRPGGPPPRPAARRARGLQHLPWQLSSPPRSSPAAASWRCVSDEARRPDPPVRLARRWRGRTRSSAAGWREAGLAVRIDAAGNLVGRLPGSEPGRRHAAARLAPRHGPRRRARSTGRSACSPRSRAWRGCGRRT